MFMIQKCSMCCLFYISNLFVQLHIELIKFIPIDSPIDWDMMKVIWRHVLLARRHLTEEWSSGRRERVNLIIVIHSSCTNDFLILCHWSTYLEQCILSISYVDKLECDITHSLSYWYGWDSFERLCVKSREWLSNVLNEGKYSATQDFKLANVLYYIPLHTIVRMWIDKNDLSFHCMHIKILYGL